MVNPGDNGLSDLLDAHVQQLHALGLTEQLTEYYCHVLNIQLDVYRSTRKPPVLPQPELSSQAIRSLPVNRKTKIKLRMLKLLGIKNLCKLHSLLHRS